MLELIKYEFIFKFRSDFDQSIILEKIFVEGAFVINLRPSENLLFGDMECGKGKKRGNDTE